MQPLEPQAAIDRPLFVCDVMPFAKRACGRCHGTGTITRVMHAGAKGESRQIDACSCAANRFRKKRHDDVVLVNGVVHWRAGKAPAIVAALPPQRTDAQPPVQVPA
jgi:hypothetical protein